MQSSSDIDALNRALGRGDVVLLPTETVYGLAADAQNNAAVEALYTLKGRNFNKPIALCVKSSAAAKSLVHWSPTAQALSDHFWPGPLSLVLPAQDGLNLDPRLFGRFADGTPTLSLRYPETDWVNHIASDYLALTSANRSGAPDTTDFDTAHAQFGSDVGASYNGGAVAIGTPSTILSIEQERVRLLRAGALTTEHFAALDLDWVIS